MREDLDVFWVFGYGSLMWRPGFPFAARKRARIHGFHRSLCVYSHVHRGTPESPGLVMGLDRGGSCEGIAYGVERAEWPETLAYLRSREQVTMVYRERLCKVRLDRSGAVVDATAFVVDRGHPQYAGKLSIAEQERLVRQGMGQSGNCRDYVVSTVAHLREMDIHDHPLETLVQRLERHQTELLSG
jgi:cation transport protein ChaC